MSIAGNLAKLSQKMQLFVAFAVLLLLPALYAASPLSGCGISGIYTTSNVWMGCTYTTVAVSLQCDGDSCTITVSGSSCSSTYYFDYSDCDGFMSIV
jgi:hypothetical protein